MVLSTCSRNELQRSVIPEVPKSPHKKKKRKKERNRKGKERRAKKKENIHLSILFFLFYCSPPRLSYFNVLYPLIWMMFLIPFFLSFFSLPLLFPFLSFPSLPFPSLPPPFPPLSLDSHSHSEAFRFVYSGISGTRCGLAVGHLFLGNEHSTGKCKYTHTLLLARPAGAAHNLNLNTIRYSIWGLVIGNGVGWGGW